MTDVKAWALAGTVVNSGWPRGSSRVLSVLAWPEAGPFPSTPANHSPVLELVLAQATACLRHIPVPISS